MKLTGILNTSAIAEGADDPARPPDRAGSWRRRTTSTCSACGSTSTSTAPTTRSSRSTARRFRLGPDNPFRSAFVARETPLRRESEGGGRREHGHRAVLGDPLGLEAQRARRADRLPAEARARHHAGAGAGGHAGGRAGRVRAAQPVGHGVRPRRAQGGRRLPEPARGRRRPARGSSRRTATLEGRDVVVWATFGTTHIARPEDWPVMPCEYVGTAAAAVRVLRPEPGDRTCRRRTAITADAAAPCARPQRARLRAPDGLDSRRVQRIPGGRPGRRRPHAPVVERRRPGARRRRLPRPDHDDGDVPRLLRPGAAGRRGVPARDDRRDAARLDDAPPAGRASRLRRRARRGVRRAPRRVPVRPGRLPRSAVAGVRAGRPGVRRGLPAAAGRLRALPPGGARAGAPRVPDRAGDHALRESAASLRRARGRAGRGLRGGRRGRRGGVQDGARVPHRAGRPRDRRRPTRAPRSCAGATPAGPSRATTRSRSATACWSA